MRVLRLVLCHHSPSWQLSSFGFRVHALADLKLVAVTCLSALVSSGYRGLIRPHPVWCHTAGLNSGACCACRSSVRNGRLRSQALFFMSCKVVSDT